MREAIAREYGIPASAWDDPPSDASTSAESMPAAASGELGDSIVEVERLLRSVLAQRKEETASPATRARLNAEARSLLKLRAHLKAQEPIDDDRVARSPLVADMLDRITGAVAPCRTCSAAVLVALERRDRA